MKNIIRLIKHDFKLLSTNVVAIVALMGLTVIPCLYAWFNILSNWDPYGPEATSKLQVAVATADSGTSIENIDVNISKTIIESLKSNTTIGWQFPDTVDEAIDGVYSGKYYAALIIPEGFSEDMISFLTDSLVHPQINYYCNQKKNAIAPKITDKAKTAVQQEVNKSFISSAASSLVDAGITIKDKNEEFDAGKQESVVTVLTNKLTTIDNELNTYNLLLSSLISITDISSNVTNLASNSTPDINSTLAEQSAKLSILQTMLNANKIESLEGLSSSLAGNIASIRSIMGSISSISTDMGANMQDYSNALSQANANLTDTQEMLENVINDLEKTIDSLNDISQNKDYGMLSSLLNTDPETLGEFLASPVEIDTENIYPITPYGSAASPFYTILSIWVGGLILVAIIHAHVKHSPQLPHNLSPVQSYLGRYWIYFVIGQLQTLLIVLGNFFYINIQCIHPFKYILACCTASFVFTFFMYSLASALGNVGEALAVVIMVIQVAGSGGTFPIEVLPEVYQMIYKFLPFPYAMDALRECIGGLYGNYYWNCLGHLLLYIPVALFIGIVIRIPFERMNHLIEKSKERSGVML